MDQWYGIQVPYQSIQLKTGDRMSHSEKFVIVLEAKPAIVPAITRLRRLLKFSLRVCRLKYVEIREKK
jgi:hypothetical protein